MELQWFGWNSHKKRWMEAMPEKKGRGEQQNKSFAVVSQNVWFSPHRWRTRTEALLRMLEEECAEYVCLQEMTEPVLQLLLSNAFVRDNYVTSTASLDEWSYDVLILMKKASIAPLSKLFRYPLDSRQGRALLMTVSPTICVATVHLESSAPNHERRKKQVEQIYGLIPPQGAILTGDMNHCFQARKECHFDLASRSLDCWAKVMRPWDMCVCV